MKKNLYAVITIAVVLSLVALLRSSHHPFDWRPTFSPDSREPLGCELFDQMMQQTMPEGYEVMDNVPDSLDAAHTAILYVKLVTAIGQQGDVEQELARARRLVALARSGSNVIVATANLRYGNVMHKDSLAMAYGLTTDATSYETYYDRQSLNDNIADMKLRQVPSMEVVWRDGQTYHVPAFMDTYTWLDKYHDQKNGYVTIARYTDEEGGDEAVLAMRRDYKTGGSITLVEMPLLFTNYAALDSELAGLTLRLLYPARRQHLVRIMGKNHIVPREPTKVENHDALSFLLQTPPLRWALYITLAMIFLMFIFGSRRKMRAIPLLQEPRNATLDFARFMGTFQYRQKDYASLVIRQYESLLYALNEMSADDVMRMPPSDIARLIVAKTHLPAEEVEPLIRHLSKLRSSQASISQRSMMKLLDQIKSVKGKV